MQFVSVDSTHFSIYFIEIGARITVSISTKLWTEQPGVFVPLHNFQTGSVGHQASFQLATGALPLLVMWPEQEDGDSPQFIAEIKKSGAIPQLPHTSS